MSDTVPSALVVSGLDPSGGAGLIADVRTLHHFGVHAAGVATTLTVQDTAGLASQEPVEPELVERQLAAVIDDIALGAAKIGALGSADIVRVVADAMQLTAFPWVADPVTHATSGAALLDDRGGDLFRSTIVPRASLLTPNASEAGWLSGGAAPRSRDEAARCAATVVGAGANAVLVTGGHFEGADRGFDVLVTRDETIVFEPVGPIHEEVHGTGCALSSAIAAQLALGTSLVQAIQTAKRWLQAAAAAPARVGAGSPAVNLHARLDPKD